MNREEKIKLAIEKGYTCDVNSGKVFGVKGGELNKINKYGYSVFKIKHNTKEYQLYSHQFIYYINNGYVVDEIDHINGERSDNRIINLRGVTTQQNQWNRTKSKGYYWNKSKNKWQTQIYLNNKKIHLGLFNTEDEARDAYLTAKQKYHKI